MAGGSEIKAEQNWFGTPPPDSSKFEGWIDFYPWLSFEPRAGKVVAGGDMLIPLTFKLNHNYPNPFNPLTTISYSVAEGGYTTITIFNILGQQVTTLVNGYQEPGEYSVIWDSRNDAGRQVSSGIYFYRLESGDFVDSKKMLLLR